jgi:tRNA 2-thiouridine synthesizing protein C
MGTAKKRLLIVCRQAPYGNSLARAGLDVALAAAAFEQDVQLLFSGDGVWQLLRDQDAGQINSKSHLKTLQSMPLYDVEYFHVDAASLAERELGAAQLDGACVLLEPGEVATFLDSFEQVLSF